MGSCDPEVPTPACQQALAFLDERMRNWGPSLRDDLLLDIPDSKRLCSRLYEEIGTSRRPLLAAMCGASHLPIRERADTILLGFRGFDLLAGRTSDLHDEPDGQAIRLAGLITLCYLSFVWVSDGLLDALEEGLPRETAAVRCAKFLRGGARREFRNAFAHGNWRRAPDNGLDYWAEACLPGGERRLVPGHASFDELRFWFDLSRCLSTAVVLRIM
jgi:hypothetical protein